MNTQTKNTYLKHQLTHQITPLILASNSPARAEILKQLSLEFTIDPANIDERLFQATSTQELVRILSHEKAKTVARRIKLV
jgi:predicted house-cleaning NTP pyrophosphatase (Maf/HAM1 superfamily)